MTNIHVDGTCCLKIYEEIRFRGAHEVLNVGHNNEYEISKVKSFKFIECQWYLWINHCLENKEHDQIYSLVDQ